MRPIRTVSARCGEPMPPSADWRLRARLVDLPGNGAGRDTMTRKDWLS
jgi:hypothetical protein